MAAMTAHMPVRPGWYCGGCGTPWPCPTRCRQLLAEHEGASVSLTVLMTGYFNDAAWDLADHPPGDLYRRFVGWTRGQPSTRS
jgi:hypothetical protein